MSRGYLEARGPPPFLSILSLSERLGPWSMCAGTGQMACPSAHPYVWAA